jgi:hypothetical protein
MIQRAKPDLPPEVIMPTSRLYDSTRTTLAARLPAVRDSQLETLTVVLVGITQSVSAQLGKIARAMPLDTTQHANEQRLRRFLDNERITQADHYQPLVRAALSGLKGQKVHLLIDRVLLHDQHNLLVVSIGFRRRSIPLTWKALSHRGKSNLADQQDLLKEALTLLPERVRVSVHGDSEFRARKLFTWLRSQHCDAMLGVQGNTYVSLTPDGPRRLLKDWLSDRATVVYLNDIYLTEEAYGPVSVIAWWAKDDDGEWIVRRVTTNLPASWQTYLRGRRRMWIETVFRDSKQFTGLEGCQCWADQALVRHVSLVFLTFVVLQLLRQSCDEPVGSVKERWQLAVIQAGEVPPEPLRACPPHLRPTA